MTRPRRKIYEYGFAVDETWVHIKSDEKAAIREAVESIRSNRKRLVEYVRENPRFRYSLEPVEVEADSPEVVKVMAEAAEAAGVGPMAAVAGALAEMAMEAMLRCGAKLALVEDGGEVSVSTDRPIHIAILSADPSFSGRMCLEVTEEDCSMGVATSSSRFGHALSFGDADSVTVVADRASIADAAATSICNAVSGGDIEASILKGLWRAREIRGVRGAIIVRGGRVGLTGRLPKIMKVTDDWQNHGTTLIETQRLL